MNNCKILDCMVNKYFCSERCNETGCPKCGMYKPITLKSLLDESQTIIESRKDVK